MMPHGFCGCDQGAVLAYPKLCKMIEFDQCKNSPADGTRDPPAGKNDSATLTALPLVKIGLSTACGGRFITSSASDNLCNALDAIRPQNVQVRRYRFPSLADRCWF